MEKSEKYYKSDQAGEEASGQENRRMERSIQEAVSNVLALEV